MIAPRSQRVITFLRRYILLALLEGLVTLVAMLSLSGDSARRGFLGLSSMRLAIVAPIVLLSLALLWASIALWRCPNRFAKLASRLSELAWRGQVYWAGLTITGILFLACINLVFLSWINTDLYLQAYLDRLTPYALWGSLLCVQTAIFLRLLRHGTDIRVFESQRKALIAALIAFFAVLLLSAWVIWTKIGLIPDRVAWGQIGVPILPTQVLLALMISLGSLLLGYLTLGALQRIYLPLLTRLMGSFIDLFICLCLWGGAVWYWGAEPLLPSDFSPAPVPPNQEYYPYSDAANYDAAAQSLLIGYGLESELVRPSYSFFLALAQAASGIGYQNALRWQIPMLALIPPLLFLIGKALHQRLSGVFVGLLAILREGNSIALAGFINVSHAKLLMSDLPTALGIIALIAILVLWLRSPVARRANLLLAGGILGLTALMRAQVLVVLPVILIVLWVPRRAPTRFIANVLLLSAGLFAVIAPWLWRNWRVRGSASLPEASQTSQIGLIGQRYSPGIEKGLRDRLPGETDDQYSSRMIDSALRFVQGHPGEVARFVSGHFIHNEIATFLSLPSSFPLVDFFRRVTTSALSGPSPKWDVQWRRCCSVRNYVNNSVLWSTWKGEGLGLSTLPLLAGLFACSVGIGTSLQRNRPAGFLILATNVIYSVGNALVRNSGWRFNLPVDWIGYTFYGIGIVQLGEWGLMWFRNQWIWQESAQMPVPLGVQLDKGQFPLKSVLLAGVVVLSLGVAIPGAEWAIPQRFRNEDVRSLIAAIDRAGELKPLGIDGPVLNEFLAQDQAQAFIGRELYPRFYEAGQGLHGSSWFGFTTRDYSRLGFFIIGLKQRHVLLRIPGPPSFFPNAADVLVLGCSKGEYMDAYMVVFLESPGKILVRSPLEGWTCPGSK